MRWVRAGGVRIGKGVSVWASPFLRLPHIPRMTATQENLFPYGDYLDSSQLHMEPDEVDTLREGEDPGTQGDGPHRGEDRDLGLLRSTPLGFFFSLPADRMHPFLAIYDLQPLKVHPLVFAPGVPVTAQVVGTERYTSGSKVVGLVPWRVGEGGLAKVEGWVGPEDSEDMIFRFLYPQVGTCTLYSVRLTHGDFTWTTKKKFRHFQELHRDLQRHKVLMSLLPLAR